MAGESVVMGFLNNIKKTSEEPEADKQQEAFGEQKVIYIDVEDLIPSEENPVGIREVEKIKPSISLMGVLQPLLVKQAEEEGKYRILAGHNRRQAVKELVEEGCEDLRKVPCILRVPALEGNSENLDEETIEIADNLSMFFTNRFKRKTDWEKMEECRQVQEYIKKLKEKGKIKGEVRTLQMEFTGETSGQIARYMAVSKNLSHEFMEAFKNEEFSISVAYELSRLPEEYQKQAWEIYLENEMITLPDIEELKVLQQEKTQKSEYERYTSGYKEVFSDADKEMHMEYLMMIPGMYDKGKQWLADKINELHGNNCKAVEEWAEKFLPVVGSMCAKMFDGKGIIIRYEYGKTFAQYPLYPFMYMFKNLYMQKPEPKKEIATGPAKCITGKSKSGVCGAAAYCVEPVQCCAQCNDKCNSQCGWLEEEKQDEQLPGQQSFEEDYPELLPDAKEDEEHCTGEVIESGEQVSQSIDELDLSVRTYNTLKRAGVDTIKELQSMSDDELARIRNFSRKCLDEVHEKLNAYVSGQSVAPAQQGETAESEAETLDVLPELQKDEPERCENAAESIWDIDLIKEQIAKQEKMLSLCIECKDTPVKVRLREEALMIGLGIMLMDVQRKEEESEEEIVQPELPLMKNNDQRKEWLRNYKSWGLWYEDEHIGARFYKYEFDNGATLIAEEFKGEETEYYRAFDSCYLHLVGGPEAPKNNCGVRKWDRHTKYNRYPNSETELVEFLKEVQKK